MRGTGTMRTAGAAVLAVALAANAGAAPPAAPFGDAYPEAPLCASRPGAAAHAPERAATDAVTPVLRRVPAGTPSSLAPPPPRDEDLYEVAWNGLTAAPVTADVPFLVRSNVAGLTIRAEAPGSGLLVSVELVSPGGDLIACRGCEDAPAVAEVEIDRGALQMPSTDRAGWELTPGEYAFRVRVLPPPDEGAARLDGEQAVVDVLATFRTDAAVAVEHVLDLNFVYLPGCSLSTAIADTSLVFAAMMDTVRAYMAPTGIGIGAVTHVDLDAPEFGVIADWEEAGNMFRTTEQTGRPRALNVYCVQAFEPPLNPVVGLSGGIPGARRNGLPDSGIAVRTSPLFVCAEFCLPAFGSLFAHEIGHYLGLYHTSENTHGQGPWDPFSDTPECYTSLGSTCPDYPNVMFALIHPNNRVWSPGQIETVTTHPLVRSMPVVGGDAPPAPDACALAFSPNPFRDEVRIEWPDADGTSERGIVRIFDVTGRNVRTLSGTNVVWDGRDGDGRPVAPGAYFARRSGTSSACTGRLVRLP